MAITTPNEFFQAFSFLGLPDCGGGSFLLDSSWWKPTTAPESGLFVKFLKKQASLYPKTITHFERLSTIIYIKIVSCRGEAWD